MDNGPSYTVYPIPAIPGQHHIVQYKDLRLQALQTDPQCFSSTYERELSLNYEQWKARLHSRDKVTIISAASFQSSERLSWQHKWVGTITVIGPKILQDSGFKPPRTAQRDGSCHLFVGVWVHPGHRGKGLGKKMISAGMDWVQRVDDHAQSGTRQPAAKKHTLLLQVEPDNQQAIGLYSSMGFHFIAPDEAEKDGSLWMSKVLGSCTL